MGVNLFSNVLTICIDSLKFMFSHFRILKKFKYSEILLLMSKWSLYIKDIDLLSFIVTIFPVSLPYSLYNMAIVLFKASFRLTSDFCFALCCLHA